ncbi:hypothetical protein F3Y22_tig00110937pilonHSYRG00059 [Hibiscus syriacus]|uniref:RNase H type-1 domain-containing protein n=1 Tax=Hibiscus syriacus TaxID=106335 RepID=A0A6A2ZBZ1_HIBSY|nr:hypothetical protein F3Y22_tig00110937pilonHSYRG00059 [Hibiscus syriacus]
MNHHHLLFLFRTTSAASSMTNTTKPDPKQIRALQSLNITTARDPCVQPSPHNATVCDTSKPFRLLVPSTSPTAPRRSSRDIESESSDFDKDDDYDGGSADDTSEKKEHHHGPNEVVLEVPSHSKWSFNHVDGWAVARLPQIFPLRSLRDLGFEQLSAGSGTLLSTYFAAIGLLTRDHQGMVVAAQALPFDRPCDVGIVKAYTITRVHRHLTVHSIRRSANTSAHSLAQFALSSDTPSYYTFDFPSCMSNILDFRDSTENNEYFSLEGSWDVFEQDSWFGDTMIADTRGLKL